MSVMSSSKQHVRFDFADGLRGVAILCVIFFHFTQTFWQHRERISDILNMDPLEGYAGASFVLPFNLGAVGVGLFLLISGLLIPLSLTRMGVLRFAVSRVFRIYPTYWAGLAVTLLALWIAAWLADNDFDITRRDVIGHVSIAFQDMLGGRNIDPVMWTLKVELWFYALLGTAFALTGKRIKWAIWLLLPLVAMLCRGPDAQGLHGQLAHFWAYDQYFLASVVCYFPLMFAGCWCYFYLTGQAGAVETVLHFVGLLALFVWVTNWPSPELYGSYAIGISLFVLGVLRPAVWSSRWLARVAAVSYAWYVCHSNAGYVLMEVLASYNLPWWLLVAAATIMTWTLALAINRWVELPTQKLGKRAADALKEKPATDNLARQ